MKRYSMFALIFVCGCGAAQQDERKKHSLEAGEGRTPRGANGSVKGAWDGDKPFRITLLTSEYPSWSTFGVAARLQPILIDGANGKLGPIEKKWNVDIELKMVTYEACITNYGATGGAICITNTDIVGLVGSRPSTAIMPTSTSFGADACIGVGGVKTEEDLKSETTYGLANSVSDYCWFRCLEKKGKNPLEYKFQNRDPEQAAQALVTGASKVAQLWNPFTLQTLRNKKDAEIIFDSELIPGEIVDMVVIDNQTLAKPGGEAAARCIADTYYSVCDLLKSQDKNTSDATYRALGDQFSSLGAEDMKWCADMASHSDPRKIVTTRFYDTPQLGANVFQSTNMDPVLEHIIRWAKVRQIIKDRPTISYGEKAAALTFERKYMEGLR